MSEATETATGNGLPARLRPWLHWRRKRFWALVAVLAYALLGHFGVPWLVERSIVNAFAQTGRTASVDRVRFNPWIFRLSVQGVKVTDPDGVKVLSLGEQVGDFEARSLFLWAWTFSELSVTSLHLEEERFEWADTRLLRLVRALEGNPDPTAAEAPADEGLPRMVVDRLAIVDTRVHFVDHTANGFDTTIGPIDVEIHDLRTLPDNEGRQQVSILTAYGDRIEWQGDLHLGPLESEGEFRLSGSSLHDTLSYLDHLMPFGLQLDGIELGLHYRFANPGSGLELAIEALDLEVTGLRARLDDDETDVASFARIGVQDASLAWPRQSVQVDSIELQGLETRAVLAADGSINLLRLLPPEQDEATAAEPGSTPWQVAVGSVSLAGSTIGIADATVQPAAELQLEELAMTLTGLDIEDGTQIPLDLTTRLASGGQAGLRGRLTLFPEFSLEGRASLTGFELKPLETYALPHARIRLDDGRLDLDAEVMVGPGDRMQASGKLAVDQLDVADTVQGERLAGWQRMAIDSFAADLATGSVRTSAIAFTEPYGRFHIAEDLSTNVSDLLVEAPEAAEDTEGDVAPLQVAIAGLEFTRAALDFSDFSLPLPFAAEIRSLDGHIGALSTQSTQPADVSLEGQVNQFGLARIEGDLNAWDFTTHADIGLVFRNLDMSRLTPYTVQFAGYAIEGGRLDLDLRYLIEGGQLRGDNAIVIKELDLGEKVEHPDAGSLPLKLAVALLTDTNGVIDIDLPVSGDLNDPTFKISGIVWRALGNLITKAVTAPFRLLGALVGVDSEDFGTLDFAPGRADLTPPDREQLLKLAEAMGQRPELSLRVDGVIAPAADRPALQAQRLDEILETRSAELSAVGQPALELDRLALEAVFTEQFPDEQPAIIAQEFTAPPAAEGETGVLDVPAYLARLRERLLAAQTVTDAELTALGQARADAVTAALAGDTPDAALNVARGEVVEVEATDSGSVPLELAVEAQ